MALRLAAQTLRITRLTHRSHSTPEPLSVAFRWSLPEHRSRYWGLHLTVIVADSLRPHAFGHHRARETAPQGGGDHFHGG